MVKIAICDDSKIELGEIANYIEEYKLEKDASFLIDVFLNPTELLLTMKDTEYDILFLDMFMPGINGIETAKEIRECNRNIPIVFITSSSEFAVKSYSVKAFSYLIKPVNKEQIFAVLDEIFSTQDRIFENVSIKTEKGITKLLFSEIVYIEVIGRKIYFHLRNNEVKETTTTLQTYEEVFLKREEFIKTHRSYIVNLFKMKEITENSFTTYTGERVPISRRLYKQVKDMFIKSTFLDWEELI